MRVRLHGIDAPERDQDCRDANGKTYSCGRAAMRALSAAVAGRSVTCTPVEVDQYNRDVAVCTVDDVDLGEAMVRGGHALDYARHSRGRYAAAEREARAARRGLWAGTFETPGDLAAAERDADRNGDDVHREIAGLVFMLTAIAGAALAQERVTFPSADGKTSARPAMCSCRPSAPSRCRRW